jgi:putative Mg2+ transporter-C (MgtC) family protein
MDGAGWDVFRLPEAEQAARVLARLLLAIVLGAALGWERERRGKAAGLRTHMLVALGAALFVLAPLESGASPGDMTRAVQGVATGIGFVGAGAVLKRTRAREIRGLTTAASIWLTAAVGMAVGIGRLWIPVAGAVLALVILAALGRLTAGGPERDARAGAATEVEPPPRPGRQRRGD